MFGARALDRKKDYNVKYSHSGPEREDACESRFRYAPRSQYDLLQKSEKTDIESQLQDLQADNGVSFSSIRVVVKIRVPFLVLIFARHLIFRVPKKGP